MKILKLSLLICLFVLCFQINSAMAWTVAPVRFEVKGEKGKEYTFTFSVLNESQLHQKRFQIQTDDWIIDKDNNFLRKAFSSKGEVENKYSATSWIKVTPQQFLVKPGETKKIRFTVKVPSDPQKDGEYSTGIFVGERNIEKPPEGKKIIHIKQDTFIGVIVYIRVGEEKPKIAFKDFKIDVKPQEKGLNIVSLKPAFVSTGNVHSRGLVNVKLEPISTIEIDKKIPDKFEAGEVVVLRESEVCYPIDVPIPLPTGSEWRFTVSADFGKDIPTLVGTKKFTIP